MDSSGDESRSWLAHAYATCRAPLLKFLHHRLGDRAEAEDAVQESFARFAAAGPVAARDKHRPYLFQIAANLLHDRFREQRGPGRMRMVSFDDSESAAHELPAADATCPVTIIEHRERLERLQQALAELPERQREALVLHRFDGLTQDEVAARMGISRRMVVKHLSRAFAYCELRVQYATVEQMDDSYTDTRGGDAA